MLAQKRLMNIHWQQTSVQWSAVANAQVTHSITAEKTKAPSIATRQTKPTTRMMLHMVRAQRKAPRRVRLMDNRLGSDCWMSDSAAWTGARSLAGWLAAAAWAVESPIGTGRGMSVHRTPGEC